MVSMDYQGMFYLKRAASPRTKLPAVKNQSVAHRLKNPSRLADMSPRSPGLMAGNVVFAVLIAIAAIAMSRTKKHTGSSDGFIKKETSTTTTTPSHDLGDVNCTTSETGRVPRPREFQWPMHLPLKQSTHFSCGEIQTIVERNCSDGASQQPPEVSSGSQKKKKLRWSPFVEVQQVEKLENRGVEWENWRGSLWYNKIDAAPELQLQKYRIRLRRGMVTE